MLATNDGRIEDVEGSAAVMAGLFFSGVSRRSFEHVKRSPTEADFELGQHRPLQATAGSAQVAAARAGPLELFARSVAATITRCPSKPRHC